MGITLNLKDLEIIVPMWQNGLGHDVTRESILTPELSLFKFNIKVHQLFMVNLSR